MTKERRFFDDEPEEDDPHAGEFFTEETLGQWSLQPWRKPDIFETYRGGARAIWYGPEGAEGDVASELIWDEPGSSDLGGGSFTFTEYQHVGGLFDKGTYDERTPFLTQSTTFTVRAVLEALREAGIEKPRRLLLWAPGLGSAQVSYWGGEDGWAESLPVADPGLDGVEGLEMSSAKDLAPIIRAARAQGIRVEKTRGGHIAFYTPKGVYFTASSPSDWRAVRNIIAHLRRRGVRL